MNKYLKLYESHSQYVEPEVKPNVSYCIQEDEVHYSPIPHDYSKDYLTIESLENNNDVYFKENYSGFEKTILISVNEGSSWTEFTSSPNNNGTFIATINKGDKLLIKGNSALGSSNRENAIHLTKNFNVEGNIMSLLYNDNFIDKTSISSYSYAFKGLFANNPNLISIENLVLPATILSIGCYSSMFQNCTSIVTTPVLPATTLTNSCYYIMFGGCTSLTTAPELPATALASLCYASMFNGCTSLITAPILPATNLVDKCYNYMFNGCTSLNYIKAMFTTTPVGTSATYSSTYDWVKNVASTGTFVKNAAATWTNVGTYAVPSGWTVQTATE